MYCPKCGTENANTSKFCLTCGFQFSQQPAQPQAPVPEENSPNQPTVLIPPKPPVLEEGFKQAGSMLGNASRQAGSLLGDASKQAGTLIGGASKAFVSIWGPFAGYGTRRRHVGWLMDNQGARANELVQKVTDKFLHRKFPDANINLVPLKGKGVIVEERPYFLIQRGLVTSGLYINRFGQDLYVSQVSYLKPPVSNFRLIMLGLMVVFFIFTNLVLPGLMNGLMQSAMTSLGGGLFGSYNSGTDLSALITALCVLGPLGLLNSLALFLFVVFSIYKYLTEKDILAGLRVQPNEFNEDDLMVIEKAVEQTVRICLDEIGLNSEDLKPIQPTHQTRVI